MKYILITLLTLIYGVCYAQSPMPVVRTSPSVLPIDKRLKAELNFYLPTGTSPTLNSGQDSVGMLFYGKADSALFLRVPNPSLPGNTWYKILSTKPIANNYYLGNTSGSTAEPTYTPMSAITKTDDTNVTLALSGTPASSVFNPVNIAVGWSGQLSVSRGGTGISSIATGAILYGNGGVYDVLTPGPNGYVLKINGSTPAWMPDSGGGGGGGGSNVIPVGVF